MVSTLIDVWDVKTFDEELLDELRCEADLIRDYTETDKRNFLEREESDHTQPYPTNPHSWTYQHFRDHIITPMMKDRTIRAWHYSRMTDAEVDSLIRDGIHVSSLSSLQRRLDAQVVAGILPAEIAAALHTSSPFHSEQHDSRSGKFWMTSVPIEISDSGVAPLLGSWGGEVVYFFLKDDSDLKRTVGRIGRSRILEIAVPLAVTKQAFSGAVAVMESFARSLGCDVRPQMFDLYAEKDLEAAAVLRVHSEGEADFIALGRGYPRSYIPVER